MNKKVSIIIPVYNGEDSISIPLNSLLEQTYTNFEAIIIDDGSKDRTKEVVEKFSSKDCRLKYYYQDNAGVSVARNKGIGVATGDYICFLDSDDFYENSFIEKMINKIEIDSAYVCYCGYNVVSPKGKSRKRTKFKSSDILTDYILANISVHTTSWVIKKEFLNESKIKFPEGVTWGEDFEFFCELLAKTTKITFVRDYLTNYRTGFEGDRLSAFSLDKLDKDFESIHRILNNTIINRSTTVDKALTAYRLPALITYRLNGAIQLGLNTNITMDYYKKYERYVCNISWNNGLRSIKLNINKLLLIYKMRMVKNNILNF